MIRSGFPIVSSVLAASLACCASAWADAPEIRPAAASQEQPDSRPVADGSLRYEVIAVQGKVRAGNMDADPLSDAGWFTPRKGDMLGAGLQINVPLRGGIKLVARPAEPPTVISIEGGSLLSIADLHLREGVATSRIKLAYGAIRAGVAEGGTRSDMEIEAPTATLSKKGTDIFRLEHHNGRFVMSLSEQGRGLLQAIQTQASSLGGVNKFRFVTPGQWVTNRMAMAVDNLVFDRRININDAFGLGSSDQLLTFLQGRGLGFLLVPGTNPGGLMTRATQQQPTTLLPQTDGMQALSAWLRGGQRTPTNQPAGNFGIGQGLVPTFIGLQQRTNVQSARALRAIGKAVAQR